jgi:hypothetical protein
MKKGSWSRKYPVFNYLFMIAAFAMLSSERCSLPNLTPAQIEDLRSAVLQVLPSNAQVEIAEAHDLLTRPSLVISAHLLEGHSPDEESPYVRGDYGTKEKLERLVKFRCARILKSIARPILRAPAIDEITILARHGVREFVLRNQVPISDGTDTPTTIFSVTFSTTFYKYQDVANMSEEDIMRRWRVNINIIRSLTIDFFWR